MTAAEARTSYGDAALLEMYRRMCLIREFEENVKDLYQRGLAAGAMHLSVGEEACAVGACWPLRAEDKILTGHRGHGHNIAKGADIPRMTAELCGRRDGLCKGRGGSMHILDASVGAMGAQGIVGAQIPIACGAALSARLRGSDEIAVAFFGDGASNIGAFHEGLNMAAVLNLPVVFVCTNNGYAVTTPVSYSVRADSIAARAAAYGMEGARADGCDVLAVCEVMEQAVERARAGGGPTLIELEAYRWYGHFVGDPCDYRTREEEAWWREHRDPIKNHGARLVEAGVCTDADLARVREAVLKEIRLANEFALASPEPEVGEMAEDLYYTAGGVRHA